MEPAVPPKRTKERKNPIIPGGPLVIIVLLMGSLVWWLSNREPPYVNLKYGELMQILQASRHDPSVVVQRVKVGRSDIRGEIVVTDPVSDGKDNGKDKQTISFRTMRIGLEDDAKLYEQLRETVGPAFQGEEEESALKGFYSVLMMIVFLGLGLLVVVVVFRWMGGGSPLSFGRSRAKLAVEKDMEITFEDVAGIDEAVAELREVVDFLRTPEKYQALGGRIPKGVLLVGPPGTGKTLLAKAVAGEASAPFFSLSGSDFVEMFVGVGAARVRDLFNTAESKAPCIIFIDELDALGKTRAGAVVGGHDEREQTLNQLLVQMDGFDTNRGVIIMAATNRPETLDPALLRAGRFDRQVVVDRPDINGREAILKVHVRHVRMGTDVDLRRVAALTPGAVGADLANLVNEAALMAARNSKVGDDGRVRRGHRARRRRPGAQEPDHERRREAARRLPRGRPCPRLLFAAEHAPGPQNLDHSARRRRPRLRLAPAGRRPLPRHPVGTGEPHQGVAGRHARRRAGLPRGVERSDERSGEGQRDCPQHG